jgi:hypothetical protein
MDKQMKKIYPDIVAYKGLYNAINGALKNIGSTISSKMGENFFCYATIRHKNRMSQISIAKNERIFIVDLWCDGVCYGIWSLYDLDEVATFLKYTIEMQLSVWKVKELLPWFDSKVGRIHEDCGGAASEVENQWNNLRKWLSEENAHLQHLIPCVELAKKFKELAVLFPYTSHNNLCFSLTTGYPFLTVGPKITAWKDFFEVRFDDENYKKVYAESELEEYLKENIVSYGIARQGVDETPLDKSKDMFLS